MSTLLEQASLVMIPSGYKEDIVYSQIPTNGNGDLSFTRASNGTRINSAGLVEVCPWNLAQYSEEFNNAAWYKSNSVITANDTTAPNGTTTADKYAANGTLTSSFFFISQYVSDAIIGQSYTATLYAKAGTLTQMMMYLGAQNGIYWNLSNGQFISYYNGVQNITAYNSEIVGNGWYKYTISINASNTSIPLESYSAKSGNITGNYTTADNYYLWGAQLNIGSTAKPYFPTTDRLNVPRLTYQNGGGGCPSLLLEKQSTNLVYPSEDFSAWNLYLGATISTNTTISPDGTQNADTLNFALSSASQLYSNQGTGTSAPYTASIYAKSSSGKKFRIKFSTPSGDLFSSDFTTTSEWQRFTYTYTERIYQIGICNESAGGTGTIQIWGAQLEESSYATSYIPTTSSSATRVADACFKTGISSLIGQTSGTVFVDAYIDNIQARAGNILFYLVGSGVDKYVLITNAGGVRYVDFPNGDITNYGYGLTNGRHKFAIAYASNDFAFYIDGNVIGTDTSGTPSVCSDFGFFYYASGYDFPLKVNEAVIFPTRLTNAELASLTTL